MKHLIYLVTVVTIMTQSSCKKFVEVDAPNTQIIRDIVFNSDKTANAAMAAVYTGILQSNPFRSGMSSIQVMGGFSSDELVWHTGGGLQAREFFENAIVSSNTSILNIWGECYNLIYRANAILEGLSQSTGVTETTRNQLTGEALFIRAFINFYLVNLFGDVPLITNTDYKANAQVIRNSRVEVYNQIIADLKSADGKMASGYSSTNNERVTPSRYAARALLARVYLFTGDWVLAEAQATLVIDETALYQLENNLNDIFRKNSKEAIWQLKPVNSTYTNEGQTYILTGPPSSVSLRDELVNSFETGDNRKAMWTASVSAPAGTFYYPFKYKERSSNSTGAEYSMVLRLAEQYLIRAEARAKQGKLLGANSAEFDINIIRNRAGLSNTTVTTPGDMFLAIEMERKFELFTEWGHRWLDLKRNDRANDILSLLKSGWSVNDQFYPIPRTELLINGNLTQNPGY
ncbi:MAG: RagB/SusD family nutrient uptake outer membrane protein [Chitinophagaceae bacterium]|nr:RagB/SusD family nutrient uptake outer membrane protein [Chitinophagaceae bacterium]